MTSKPTAYDMFRYERSAKLHFTSNFNVDKYGFKSKTVSQSAFNNLRHGKHFYERGARKFRTRAGMMRYFGVVYFWFPNSYIVDIWNKEQEPYATKWREYRKFMMAPEHHASDALVKTDTQSIDGELPALIDKISSGDDIAAYTAVMLDKCFHWYDYVDSKVGKDHLIWETVRDRLRNLEPFVRFSDTTKYDSIGNAMRNKLTQTETN